MTRILSKLSVYFVQKGERDTILMKKGQNSFHKNEKTLNRNP